MNTEGKVVIFCAPSGSGKTTITRRMMELFPELSFSISATTRAPRGTEQDGVEYYFVTKERFQEMVAAGNFLEWESFYDNYYGTLKSEVERLTALGKVPVFDIEVLGAWNIKQMYKDRALMIFIKAPIETITQRLKSRATDSPEAIQTRIERYPLELSYEAKADVVIENIDLEKAVADTQSALASFLR